MMQINNFQAKRIGLIFAQRLNKKTFFDTDSSISKMLEVQNVPPIRNCNIRCSLRILKNIIC